MDEVAILPPGLQLLLKFMTSGSAVSIEGTPGAM